MDNAIKSAAFLPLFAAFFPRDAIQKSGKKRQKSGMLDVDNALKSSENSMFKFEIANSAAVAHAGVAHTEPRRRRTRQGDLLKSPCRIAEVALVTWGKSAHISGEIRADEQRPLGTKEIWKGRK